ncbi:MAG: radical SAM protein [uncultured bacterium]|nr:MAG: radical SAM protein [uncultured bacterium]KKP68476.1 MAG: hypothetical protein UR66_C0005G0023 [Candidatus Moranbacteria bacterium GW2011_GWE1_35_17]KKP70390.1 MAG: hypothetical protein UR65_C0044G0005 [Candidatus Moranbacteria bacterium GW2011_GWE2_35_164]KKP83778.1 MAG: hypothetical protein UR83_C0033G0008 [Candidatus Moranbacteria bacterium GW2011_GWF2_35_54]HBR79164.1 hypothetical protein [Candidatus Moranbacteria bacterium]
MLRIETDDEILELFLCHAQINITTDCNMRCKHCRGAYEDKEVVNIGLADFRNILLFTREHLGEGAGYLISGGEPLKHPQFRELMIELSNYPKAGEFVTITTNGSLLKDSTLDFLQSLNFPELRISVSLDSSSQEIHDEFRGFNKAYQRAIQAIRLIGKRDGIRGIVRATIRQEQLDELFDIAMIAHSCGADALSVSSIIPSGTALRDPSLFFTAETKKKLSDMIKELREEFKGRMTIDLNDPLAYIDSESVSCGCEDEYGGCIAGIGTFSVEPDGVMLPCPLLPNHPIMNCLGKSSEEILTGYISSPFILELIQRNLKGKCGKCRMRFSCGGCRARAAYASGDYMGEDPDCWF